MLKRVRRRSSKHQSTEKPDDFRNSAKKDSTSEVEALQQVITELRTEVSELKEELEKEKKAVNEVKSLKTQQVSTLTSKLANAVRQREQAEQELAKVKKEMEEFKEKLDTQGEESKVKESENVTNGYSEQDENSTEQYQVEETDEANKEDNSKAIDNNIASSCLEKDESNLEEELVVNRKGSLQSENKSDVQSSEDSFQSCLHEYSPKEELCQSVSLIEVSLSSCSELGDDFSKENSSFQDKLDGLFDHEDLLISSPEIYDTNLADISLESLEENTKAITETLQGSKKIQEDLCEIQESLSTADDVKKVVERGQQMSEKPCPFSALKNKRIRSQSSEEDQESSPPTSPEAVSSGYTSNSTEERLENLLLHHGMASDHNTAMFPGNGEVQPKGFFDEAKKDDVTDRGKRVQEKKGLEDFTKREQVAGPILKENYKTSEVSASSLKNTENKAEKEKAAKQSSERQNDFLTQTMGEEVFDLKHQLKNAMKEIDELRLENKQMKKEIKNLSSTTAEEEFLLKTTRFTERLLREMKEREARVNVPRTPSAFEKYGLEREYSYPRLTELSQMRATRDMNRPTARKTSLPLKIIGAKLKELTRSVENMVTDPELCEDVFSPDHIGYQQRYPSLNDQFELEDSLLMPMVSSETLSAQKTSLNHEGPGDAPRGGSFTFVEKLGQDRFLAAAKTQLQFTAEKDCPWREFKCQLAERQMQEQSGLKNPSNNKWKLYRDTRDYVERYIVRSSDHIAKMRDLTPEEIAFYSKLA